MTAHRHTVSKPASPAHQRHAPATTSGGLSALLPAGVLRFEADAHGHERAIIGVVLAEAPSAEGMRDRADLDLSVADHARVARASAVAIIGLNAGEDVTTLARCAPLRAIPPLPAGRG